MFNVNFIYHQKSYPKRPNKITITGIYNENKCTCLYHDDKKVSKFMKTATECHIHPGSENVFDFV